MGLTESHVAEADLHAFVDGRLTLDRRADVLRLLSSSRADRALIEAWQEQNDALRGAFAGVEREPLPPSLNLTPLPHLRLAEPIAPEAEPARSRHNGRVFAALATAAIVLAGFAGAWALRDTSSGDVVVDGGSRSAIEEGLAKSAIAALAKGNGAPRGNRHPGGGSLPTTTIPDLGRSGFDFIRAEAAVLPASLVFHYENAAAERVVISVARGAGMRASPAPARIGGAWSWYRHDKAYALAGTVPAGRLRALATALQGGDGID